MSFERILHRLLNENSKNEAEEAIRLLIKIADNILNDPSNLKIRILQKHNVSVCKKILPAKGSLECLKLMGFQEQEKCYILPTNTSLINLEKFKNTVAIWKAAQDAGISNSDVSKVEKKPEQVIKKIKLPPLVLTYSNPFLRNVERHYHNVLQYEDKELQQRALKLVPLATLEENAQKRLRTIQEHIKKNKLEDPDISIQETLILELLNWFKEDFFSWVDNPECSYCGGKTVTSHMSNDPSLLVYTDRVELHKCTDCHKFTPFPRYNDVNILLETRKGRCGEWANTFTFFCRAMGWDSRFVVDVGDHVWTEVYSVTQKRWLHCDPCENICDTPLMYETGWNKQISYVIAYSSEEVQDVTWRYSTNHRAVLKRRKLCSENELLKALSELRLKRQNNLSESRRNYLTKRLLSELVEFLSEKKPTDGDQKGRSSGSASWRLARGEIQEELVEHPLNVWQINGDDIVDNNITIRYSTSLDRYEYISGGKILKIVKEWHKGVFKCSQIFRKEEKDWKMIYLARREGQETGSISWKVELKNCFKSIDTVSLRFERTTYENGVIKVQISSENKQILVENGCERIVDFGGSRDLIISATLSEGRGNVSWQHAQLFRQSSEDEDFPFSLNITFK